MLCYNYKDEFDKLSGQNSFNNYVNYDIMVTANEEIYKIAAKERGGGNYLLNFLTVFAFNNGLLPTQIISKALYALK